MVRYSVLLCEESTKDRLLSEKTDEFLSVKH